MSRAEHARWRSKIQTQLHRDGLKRQRLKIAGLQDAVRATKARKRAALKRHRERCAASRVKLREIVKAKKVAVRAELKEEIDELRASAKNRCQARKIDISASGKSAESKARARLAVARADRREMSRIGKIKTESKSRASRAELRGEDNDRVRSNIDAIDPRWVPIWDKIKNQIKARPGMTRTEAFIDWAHHSEEEIAAMESTAETAMLADLESELEREQRAHAKRAAGKDREHRRALKEEAESRLTAAARVARKKCGPGMTKAQLRECLEEASWAELEPAPF